MNARYLLFCKSNIKETKSFSTTNNFAQKKSSTSLVKLEEIKPGAIIITVSPVTPAEDLWVLFWPRHRVTHAMLYTPTSNKVNNVTHAIIGKNLCVKSHTLTFMALQDNEDVHIFNPKDDFLGKLAVAQIKRWENFGLNYDVKKFSQGKSFSLHAKPPDTIYTLFDPAQIIKLVYRRYLPKTRIQKKREIESGVTCHSLLMDVYNTVWLGNKLDQMNILISPSLSKDVEYVSVKYAKSADPQKAKRPYYFPKEHFLRSDVDQRQSENYYDSADYHAHPRGKHPYELIPKKRLDEVIKLAYQCPFSCNSKWATVTNLYDHLLTSDFFEHVGILDKKSINHISDEKEKSLAEAKFLDEEIYTQRNKLI